MVLEDKLRPLFMISVAAELADMHPQTLRMYERRGLIRPRRSRGSTRLYSLEDVERLRKIQRMINEEGLNLAGVERVLCLEDQIEKLQRRIEHLEAEIERLKQEAEQQIEAVHKSYKRELVLYSAPGQVVLVRRRSSGS